MTNKSPVPDKDATTLCFDELAHVRSNCCDCSVDVPHFGGGILHCNMVANLKVGQGVGMFITGGLGVSNVHQLLDWISATLVQRIDGGRVEYFVLGGQIVFVWVKLHYFDGVFLYWRSACESWSQLTVRNLDPACTLQSELPLVGFWRRKPKPRVLESAWRRVSLEGS